MPGQIKFAIVSDSDTIGSRFLVLPETVPVHCCDGWVIQRTKTSKKFYAGLIFYFERDEEVVLGAFERSKVCRIWQPTETSDRGCIFVNWDQKVSAEQHTANVDTVKFIINEMSKVLMDGEVPNFSEIVTEKNIRSFISFRKGRGYIPALIGALNDHPLLKGSSFFFARRRKQTKDRTEVQRLQTEEVMSHGEFTTKPRKIKTRKIANE